MASQGKDLSGFEKFPYKNKIYTEFEDRVKSYGEGSYESNKAAPTIEKNVKAYELGFSL